MAPVEVSARNVETVYMRWDDGQEEQEAVEHSIVASSCKHHDGQRREEDVDDRQDDPVGESFHLGSFLNYVLLFQAVVVPAWVVRKVGRSKLRQHARSLERSKEMQNE